VVGVGEGDVFVTIHGKMKKTEKAWIVPLVKSINWILILSAGLFIGFLSAFFFLGRGSL
jgi:hypothetical protein